MQVRMATLTNKCVGDADLDYYVLEAGHITGLRLAEDATAKVRCTHTAQIYCACYSLR